MGLRVLHACQESMENYCENHASLNGMGGGLGFDGGMADYMLVPFDTVSRAARQFESRESGAAERRGFHSISCDRLALPSLHAGTTAAVLGIGGLGHMAVQLLRVLTPARIIAGDVDQSRLDQAKGSGPTIR